MKKICFLFFLLAGAAIAFAQKETLDLTTYTVLKGWKKQLQGNVVQFIKQDKATGAYCAITLYKSVEASADAKKNFDDAWETIIKSLVTVKDAPQMQEPAKENEWDVQSGSANFEAEGSKGVVVLATVTGYQHMINLVIITNTGAYEKEVSAFMESLSFKKPATTIAKTNTPVSKPNTTANNTVAPPVAAPAKKGSFTFTTTNFDDGWTSTVQEDWVQVLKGGIKILIHYPNAKADAYNSVLKEQDYNAWNILVAPRYSNMSNFEWKTIQSWQSITFVQADATENATGKKVHIVLFKKHYSNGSGAYLEFVTDTKADYEKEFGPYHNTEFDWDKTANMQFRNKFAVAASDLNGTWTNNFSGMTQYVNAYTGASAGADTHASSQKFIFGENSTYKWDIGVASGFVGNIKFQSAKSNGKFTLPSAWQIYFSEMEGKPKTYDAYFSCVKGSRLLWLSDVTYPGYSAYGKAN
ncbi:hypothetical protein [Ferruginibacter sp. SUN106]|uniref:hypothetical protein n=1 Tax=Ferruginibacter sp. SUN106 TaxID=2978348 RepID=UPI003D35A00B